MFRPIRRKAKEISLEETKQVLRTARYGFFAVNGDDGYPYAVPVNYFYDEENEKIYFHGAKAGHKYDSLKRCDKVCFTVCGEERIEEEDWAPFVKSALIFGRGRFVDDAGESLRLVRRLAEKFYPDASEIDKEIEKAGKAVQMYEISIEHLSGKQIQEK